MEDESATDWARGALGAFAHEKLLLQLIALVQ